MTSLELVDAWVLEARARCPHASVAGLPPERADYFLAHPPSLVIGADEVGYGALAGPVTVCAVAAPTHWSMAGLRDSKKMKGRIAPFARALAHDPQLQHHTCHIGSEGIDRWGLVLARQIAFEECLEQLRERLGPAFEEALIILDGAVSVRHILHMALPKADDIVPAVSAASVLAKHARDSWMIEIAHPQYPGYFFADSVGYGSEAHRRALARLGPCPLHRKSFNVKPFQEKP